MDERSLLWLLILFVWRQINRRRLQGRIRRRRQLVLSLLQRNRTRLLHILQQTQANLLIYALDNTLNPRLFWMIPRPQHWFEEIVSNPGLELYWKSHFRIKRETFDSIIQLVGPQLQRQDTFLRSAIPIGKRIAIALWRLATGDSYRAVSTLFGIGKSTAVKITIEFCRALVSHHNEFIICPKSRDETMIAIAAFREEMNCRIPQALGAIDGTHIEIIAPSEVNKFDYFDRNKRYSIIIQGVVGAQLKFLDVEIGYPGSMHDCRVMRNSLIFEKAENGDIFDHPRRNINGVEVRPLLLADGAYINVPWIIKPFPQHHALTASQTQYNKALSSARSSVERGFGLLKARWRVLLKRMDNRFNEVPTIVLACCILHNICQDLGDIYLDTEFLDEVIRCERRYAASRRNINVFNPDGDRTREAIKAYL